MLRPVSLSAVLVILAIIFPATNSEENKLTCYNCRGYRAGELEDAVTNNPDCDVDSFSPTSLHTVTEVEKNDTTFAVCYTFVIRDGVHNEKRPYTKRGLAYSTIVPNLSSMDRFFRDLSSLDGEDVYSRASPSSQVDSVSAGKKLAANININIEICQDDLCNNKNSASNSGLLSLLLVLCLSIIIV
ncbi:uncharacterized protein LOC108682992 [Hyalella azteca]|uniref:Uncharacterized protein LOC108682992 n=1 Tax=Hyalella azteca TaxID=294128 RepID=A0A8B7PNH4_HYAAZ|nr:uncharacterized protein LOC108682992 [Hyalella azteca]